LQKIHWDADQEDLAGVTRELEERLVVLGRDRFGLAAQEARRLKDLLIYHVLESSIIKDRAKRVLTRAELYTAFDAATQVVVPRQAANAMAQLGPMLAAALTGGQGGGSFAPADISWITRGDELPTPVAPSPTCHAAARWCPLSVGCGRFDGKRSRVAPALALTGGLDDGANF
jgi:hypothetical protein